MIPMTRSPDGSITRSQLLPAHRLKASSVEFEQLRGIIFGFGGRACALKADSGPSRLTIAGGHGDKFHEVKRDVFVAAGAHRKRGRFHDQTPECKAKIRRLAGSSAMIAEALGVERLRKRTDFASGRCRAATAGAHIPPSLP